jgi:geranylgeranyl pyrophosphate synthase
MIGEFVEVEGAFDGEFVVVDAFELADLVVELVLDVTDDLFEYVYGSAAVIGLQMVPILEPSAPEAYARAQDLGVAFQIQDDLLDLTGEAEVVGKPVAKDLEKGKLTLPLIHHLASAGHEERRRLIAMLSEAASGDDAAIARVRGSIRSTLEASGSVEHARKSARALVERAKGRIATLPDSGAATMLRAMADAVVTRSY